MVQPRSHTERVAEFVSSLNYDDLSPSLIAHQRLVLIDTFACILAGSRLGAGCEDVVLASRALGDAGRSTLIATGEEVSSARAAYVNGCHVHALNFDASGVAGGHIGLVALVPALAVAESLDVPVGGRELLVASIVAGEVFERLTLAARGRGTVIRGRRDGGWLTGQVLGYFAAAAAAASILSLDRKRTVSALTFALMQAAGTKQVMVEGDTPAKGLYGGFANLGGVLAAVLAASGIEAYTNAFEGQCGLLPVFFETGEAQLEEAFATLGNEFYMSRSNIKKWPVSGVVHPYVVAAVRVAESTNTISASMIERVLISGWPRERDWFEPRDIRCAPNNAAAAGNSVQFAVTQGLISGTVPLESLTPSALSSKRGKATMSKIDHQFVDADRPRTLEVWLRGGEHLHTEVPHNRETWAASQADVEAKLLAGNAVASHPLPRRSLMEIFTSLRQIDEVQSVRSIFEPIRENS